MSKKIKLPEFENFENAYNEEFDTVESRDYIHCFVAVIDDEGDYLYGFISPTGYYDDAIAKSDDITIKKRTKGNLKRTYEKIIKQLCDRYKKWVDSLYIQPPKEIQNEHKDRKCDLKTVG